MPKFRNVRVGKRGGGFRIQRARVLASGKLKFVKNLIRTRSTRSTSSKRVSRRTRRANTMPRRKKSRGSKAKGLTSNKTGKLIAMGFGAGLVGLAGGAVKNFLPAQLQLSDEIVGGVTGLILDNTTSGIPKQLGQGMIVASIGSFTATLTSGFLGGMGSGNSGTGFQIQS